MAYNLVNVASCHVVCAYDGHVLIECPKKCPIDVAVICLPSRGVPNFMKFSQNTWLVRKDSSRIAILRLG
jgi:hypothetical protein